MLEAAFISLKFAAWVWLISLIGSGLLKLLSLDEFKGAPRFTANFFTGLSVYSLILFLFAFYGKLSATLCVVLLLLGLPLIFYKKHRNTKPHPLPHFEKAHIAPLVFTLLAALVFIAASAPSLSTEGLAHTFAYSRSIAENTGLIFFPIAEHFAAPSLSAMLGGSLILLGGEQMMHHFWAFLAIMFALSAYSLARRRLRTTASWIFAALVLTVPFTLEAALAGKEELFLAALTAMSALALSYYARSGRKSWLFIMALFVATALSESYLGIFLLLALTFTLVFAMKELPVKTLCTHLGLFFGLSLLMGSGFYIYLQNMSGDFLFPYLFTPLETTGWTLDQNIFYEQTLAEHTRDGGFFDFFWSLPWELTEQTSTFTLGALFLMALIPSLILFFRRFPFMTWEQHVNAQDLGFLTFLLFYFFAYLTLPNIGGEVLFIMLPLVLMPAFVWGLQFLALSSTPLRFTLFAITAALFAFQTSLLAYQVAPMLKSMATHEVMLAKHIQGATLAKGINERLDAKSKILFTEDLGALNSLLIGPRKAYSPAALQGLIPISTGDGGEVLTAMFKEGITHWATTGDVMNSAEDTFTNGHHTLRRLIELDCFQPVLLHGAPVELLTLPRRKKEVGYTLYKVSNRCMGFI